MEFEIFSDDAGQAGFLRQLERVLVDRRRTWIAAPPQRLAWALAFVLSFEGVLAYRVWMDLPFEKAMFREWAGGLVGLVALEWIVLTAVGTVTEAVRKSGGRWTLLGLLHLGLLPFFWVAPLTLLWRFTLWPESALAASLLILVLFALNNWRRTLESALKLSRLQSGVAFCIGLSVVSMAIVVTSVLSLSRQISDFLAG